MVTQMDYPSTTQALFALIVMIIVLVFILVYCCWGTFACSKNQDLSPQLEANVRNRRSNANNRDPNNRRALVILPYNNMVYIGDRESRRVYHIPVSHVRNDKPPSYKDLFTALPPDYSSQEIPESQDPNMDKPPTYEECLTLFRDAPQTTEDADKFIVASMEDLMDMCTSLSNSSSASFSCRFTDPTSFSASSEPVLSSLNNEDESAVSPLSRIKSNFLKSHLLKSRSHQSEGAQAGLTNEIVGTPLTNPPSQLSKTLDNLALTVSAERFCPLQVAPPSDVSNSCSEVSQDLGQSCLVTTSEMRGGQVSYEPERV